MKVMKLKIMFIALGLGFLAFLGLLAFVAIFISNEEHSLDSDDSIDEIGGISVSADVLKHQAMVEKYAKEYGILEYVSTLLAIIEVESGGKLKDVMQSMNHWDYHQTHWIPKHRFNKGQNTLRIYYVPQKQAVSMRIQSFKHITMAVLLLITLQKETHNIVLD